MSRAERGSIRLADWVDVQSAAYMLGLSARAIKNRVERGRFPRPDYIADSRGKAFLWRRSTIISYFFDDTSAFMREDPRLVARMMADTDFITQCRRVQKKGI